MVVEVTAVGEAVVEDGGLEHPENPAIAAAVKLIIKKQILRIILNSSIPW